MIPYAYVKKYQKIVMRYHAAFEKNAFQYLLFNAQAKLTHLSDAKTLAEMTQCCQKLRIFLVFHGRITL